MDTILYLVRHGETVDNANQIMQGQTQGELNENGVRQAREFAEQWKDRDIDVVIASDLKRSVDTATIIAAPHGLEVVKTPLLRERDWGGFTGRFIPDLKGEVWPDDIETLENLLSRAGEFIAYPKADAAFEWHEFVRFRDYLAVGHGPFQRRCRGKKQSCGHFLKSPDFVVDYIKNTSWLCKVCEAVFTTKAKYGRITPCLTQKRS